MLAAWLMKAAARVTKTVRRMWEEQLELPGPSQRSTAAGRLGL